VEELTSVLELNAAAKMLGIKPRFLRRLVHISDIPHRRFAKKGKIYFYAQTLLKWWSVNSIPKSQKKF